MGPDVEECFNFDVESGGVLKWGVPLNHLLLTPMVLVISHFMLLKDV